MTANMMLNNYLEFELRKAEDADVIKNMTLAIKNEFVSGHTVTNNEEEGLVEEYAKILSMTTMAVKMYAHSYYKNNPYLDSSEIDQIKRSLVNYANDKAKLKDFKNEIIEDLTAFQNQIKENHIQRISELRKQKRVLENEIKHLDISKNKLIMDRLSKIVWPYDSKTKEYDNKIAAMQAKIDYYSKKIEDTVALRPAANEKDILLYQMRLKEKYAK